MIRKFINQHDQWFLPIMCCKKKTTHSLCTKVSQGYCYTLSKLSRRIEMKTFLKLLSYSYEHGPERKTNMATHCKMSYTRFIPILNLMMLFGFLEIKESSDKISITEHGKKILMKLQNATYKID